MKVRKRIGFTLVEAVIAVVLCVFVMGVAYKIWSYSRLQISRSTTRQILQKDIRSASEIIARDLKAAKANSLKIPASEGMAQESLKKFGLERFIEIDKDKVANESIEKIVYDSEPPLLKRSRIGGDVTNPDQMKILATHLDFIDLGPEDEAEESSPTGTSTSKKPQDIKRSYIKLVLGGKMRVPGSDLFEFHIERTSVVMRDDFFRSSNPAYRSNSDLANAPTDQVIVSNSDFDAFFKPGEPITAESLKQLSDPQLNDFIAQQKENLSNIEKTLKSINDNINDAIPPGSVLTNVGNWLKSKAGMEQSFIGKVQDFGNNLSSSDDLEKIKTELKSFQAVMSNKEDEFIEKAYGQKVFDSSKERDLVRQALKAKMHDRKVILNALPKDPNSTTPQTIPLVIKAMTTVEPMANESKEDFEKRKKQAQHFEEIYNKIDLRKIVAPGKNLSHSDGKDIPIGDESDDYKAFESASKLYEIASTKIAAIETKMKTEANIKLAETEQLSRPNK